MNIKASLLSRVPTRSLVNDRRHRRPDFLRAAFPSADVSPAGVLVRLVAAMLLGAVVAFIYRRTRPASDVAQSFQVTLVLLSILIAMVTQVIGDNVARAFSLVGALSIVRFRTSCATRRTRHSSSLRAFLLK